MSGHSKWSTIKRQKGATDAKRGQLFTKLAREIMVAAKSGIPDPDANVRLRIAIQKARAENMPKDNIERAIKKAAGSDGENFENVRYEGYGPGGVALIIEALTDNRTRTVGEVRTYFTKSGGALAETGAVSFMFNHIGVIEYDAAKADADTMLEAGIDAGADDVISGDEGHEIVTATDSLNEVQKALEAKFGEPKKSSLLWRPQNTIAVDDEAGEKLMKLVENLEENDDVQNVYGNFEISEALMAKLSA